MLGLGAGGFVAEFPGKVRFNSPAGWIRSSLSAMTVASNDLDIDVITGFGQRIDSRNQFAEMDGRCGFRRQSQLA